MTLACSYSYANNNHTLLPLPTQKETMWFDNGELDIWLSTWDGLVFHILLKEQFSLSVSNGTRTFL